MNIKRTSIVNIRSPITIYRKIDNPKISLCNINSKIPNAKSLYLTTDCTGNKFMYVNKLTNVSKRVISKYLDTIESSPYFYINVSFIDNLSFISWVIKKVTNKGIPIYLETDRDLSENILDDLSNNPFNIIQCNISQIANEKNKYISKKEYDRIQKLRTLPYKSKIRGLYVILCIDPIVPQVTHLENILIMLVAEKNSYNHIILSFIKIPRILKARDYVTYKAYTEDSVRLDADYFELKDNIWECANWYKEIILEDIKYLVKEHQISICGETRNCKGMKLKEVIKTDKGDFALDG